MAQNLSLVANVGDASDVKRDVVIRLLVTQAERDAMQAAAGEEEVTLSEWIRKRCIVTTTTVRALSNAQYEASANFYAVHGRHPTDAEMADAVAKMGNRRLSTPAKKGKR